LPGFHGDQAVFLGRYHHALDAKGRVAIPSRLRGELEDGAVLTRGADTCLALYPSDVWQGLCDRIAALPVSDSAARAFRRFVFSEATRLEFDSQGRVLIPQSLRSYAGIERNVVIVGMDTMIEIWSESAWEVVGRDLDLQADEIITRLASMI
jgi:MraZ protein